MTEKEEKNHMIISIDAEKHFDKIQVISDKNSQQTEHRRKLPQPDKHIYEKPTVNIVLNGERVNTFILRLEIRQGCLLLLLLLCIILSFVAY